MINRYRPKYKWMAKGGSDGREAGVPFGRPRSKGAGLSWNIGNLVDLILYHEFKDSLVNKPPKNTQFSIRWAFARFLKGYYGKSSLDNVERDLDVILFRTHWFLNNGEVRFAIKNGLISINNVVVRVPGTLIQPGDLIRFDASRRGEGPQGRFNKLFSNTSKALSTPFPINLPGTEGPNQGFALPIKKTPDNKGKTQYKEGEIIKNKMESPVDWIKINNLGTITMGKEKLNELNEWKKKSPLNMIQNLNYLEINNNIKTLILLYSPKFFNIPYPFNLHKFFR